MLGLGKWKLAVKTRFYSGDAFMIIGEKDGGYDIRVELASGKKPDFRFSNLRAEGNTLTGYAQHSLLQGEMIPFSATFEDDTVTGFLDVPFVGMIRFKDGVRVG